MPQEDHTLGFAIAIPCFRESARLPPFLRSLLESLQAQDVSAKVIVVDDGSGEPEAQLTEKIVQGLRDDFPGLLLPLLKLDHNQGKGGAVYSGWRQMLAENPEWLCFVDADGSVPAREVCRAMKYLQRSSEPQLDALLGSRVKMMGRNIERLWSRHVIGRIFATLVTTITGVVIYDSQCGLKCVSANAFRTVADSLQERRFIFDVELIAALLSRHYTVHEFPIDWKEIPGSKVRIVKDSWRMFRGLLRIRRSHGPIEQNSSTGEESE